jgi:signal transduction histidine kinase/CheY-like chemotaxis protein/HPt (histidine-containing phosphotransfer) domain-containing protein
MKRSRLPQFFFSIGLLCILAGCAALPAEQDTPENSFYIDLNEYPLYVKNGFDAAGVTGIPDPAGGLWLIKRPADRNDSANIQSLGLPDTPPRRFLSPFKEKVREYTMVTPFVVSPEQFEVICGTRPLQPGIFLAAIGDNWEIFLNGTLIKSEIHLDGEGQIRSGRAWRYIPLPLDRSLFIQGTNILAFRIIGTPHADITGLWYQGPYYIDDYETIRKIHNESLPIAVCGIYIFVGLYHFLLFVSRPRDRYNLYYCFFSVCLGSYFFMRSNAVSSFIPNSDIIFRLEYASLYMVIPMLPIFLEHLNHGKTIRLSRVCVGISLLFTLVQAILPNSFGDDLLYVWWGFALFELLYIIGYNMVYTFMRDIRIQMNIVGNRFLPEILLKSFVKTPLGNIIIGGFIVSVTAFVDVTGSIFLRYGIVNYSRYGLFIFTITTTIILARRFGSLFRRIDEMNALLEKSNQGLEDTVRARTRELEQQTAVAESASRAKSDFLARMSHEIRSPLNVILGLSEVELQKTLPEGTAVNLEKVYRSGVHLLEIINDILDISKIESGNFEIHPREYEFPLLISDMVQLNLPRIGIRPIKFKLDLDETIPAKLYGDELRIKQILNNLLTNAFKYTEEGEVRLEVGWERRDGGASLLFAVEDTGRGIKPRDMHRLFSDYTQFDAVSNRRIEGTGLGLSIARGLTEMMGGAISADSAYGKGSTFRVSLPQGIVDEAPIGSEQAEKLRSLYLIGEKNPNRGNFIRSYMPYGKVLVVDDLETNLDVMLGLLMPYGLQVDTVLSGQEAVEAILKGDPRYDLVFMDHMMPEMDGVEAVRIIRNEIGGGYARTVPIIVLTANAVAGNREKFLENGFNDFISKPIDIKQLDAALNRWVRDKQSGAALREAELQRGEAGGRRIEDGKIDAEGRQILEHPIEEIDFPAALTRYGNNGAAYLSILKSFAAHTPRLLEQIESSRESSLPNYAVEVHGLKGACNAIGAGETAALAGELETAAREGNLDFVRSGHGDLARQLRSLLDNLGALLTEWDAAGPPEERGPRAEPDRELLISLSAAAVEFNSDRIEEILKELEKYRYERGGGLIRRLREQAELFDYGALRRILDGVV